MVPEMITNDDEDLHTVIEVKLKELEQWNKRELEVKAQIGEVDRRKEEILGHVLKIKLNSKKHVPISGNFKIDFSEENKVLDSAV